MQKVTKKHARTCKKLPVASFCASETAETGRIANGCEQGDHVSRRRRSPATSIQIAGRYGVFVKMSGVHQVPDYAENYIFPGIAGNDLNRCDAPALQRKDLEQRLKEQLYSLVDSRLRIVRMGDGGWKRAALDSNKERFVKKKSFWLVKMGIFRGQRRKACAKEVFVRKKVALSEVRNVFC